MHSRRCKLRCILYWGGSQVFEKSVNPFKVLIPSCTHPLHAHSFRDIMCACFLQEWKNPRGIVTQRWQYRGCYTVTYTLRCLSFNFDDRNAKGERELFMMREKLGRHFTQMKQQYFNADLCTRTLKIDNSNFILFTSQIATTIAGAFLAPSPRRVCEKHRHRLLAVCPPLV